MKHRIVDTLKFVKLGKKKLRDLIEVPKDFSKGDYAFPCFVLAKREKKNPGEIAKEIVSKASKKATKAGFDRIQAEGPYVNFFVDQKRFAKDLIEKIEKEKERYGKNKEIKERAVVEFSQPNTHKAFHIGHIRGTSLGESISRILEFKGNKVIRANYSGDTGKHIAKWLWGYQKYHLKEKPINEESWFAKIYVNSVNNLEKSKKGQEEVEEINRKLDERSDKKLNKLWDSTKKLSISSWDKIYHELNTRFDVHYFESEVEQEAKKVAKKLVKKKIAKISDGATIVDFKDYKEGNLNVFLLLRKDGTVLYGGKDIVLAQKKLRDYKFDKSIYVIGKEQELYAHQVFKTLELMKYKKAKNLFYVPVTEVRLPHGKMSSRTGDNVLYSEFKDEIVKYAAKEIEERFPKLESDKIYDRALAIAISGLKYSMLKQDNNKSIVFDSKKALSFEGDTGPYLLYSYARALSILDKAEYKKRKKFEIVEIKDSERKLINVISRFPGIVEHAYRDFAPNLIANYSFELAKTFSEFYHNCQVIGSEQEQFRLKLVDSFSQVIKNSLGLLGIPVIPEM
jgi:arginyl-tRNA synthetase